MPTLSCIRSLSSTLLIVIWPFFSGHPSLFSGIPGQVGFPSHVQLLPSQIENRRFVGFWLRRWWRRMWKLFRFIAKMGSHFSPWPNPRYVSSTFFIFSMKNRWFFGSSLWLCPSGLDILATSPSNKLNSSIWEKHASWRVRGFRLACFFWFYLEWSLSILLWLRAAALGALWSK